MAGQIHRKRLQHYERAGHLHELTFSCYRRRPLLTNDRWRSILAEQLQTACDVEDFELIAFVFMPEHVHLLVHPYEGMSKLSRLLARTKQPTSKAIKELLAKCNSPLLRELTVRERPGRCCFRFWQEGVGFDRNLFSAGAVEASIDYIHTNPVTRGLCRRATDWKWSSARFFAGQPPDPDLLRLSRLDPAWFDRSGVHVEHS